MEAGPVDVGEEADATVVDAPDDDDRADVWALAADPIAARSLRPFGIAAHATATKATTASTPTAIHFVRLAT